MSVNEFKPMADNASVVNVGGVTIENTGDTVLVSGTIEFSRDEASVNQARDLAELFAKIADKLNADIKAGLVSEGPEEGAVTKVANPFA